MANKVLCLCLDSYCSHNHHCHWFYLILLPTNFATNFLLHSQVFLFQKSAVYKCNMAGKPAVVTRVVDSMTDNLRPTRAEATDVANAVLDGKSLVYLLTPGPASYMCSIKALLQLQLFFKNFYGFDFGMLFLFRKFHVLYNETLFKDCIFYGFKLSTS